MTDCCISNKKGFFCEMNMKYLCSYFENMSPINWKLWSNMPIFERNINKRNLTYTFANY